MPFASAMQAGLDPTLLLVMVAVTFVVMAVLSFAIRRMLYIVPPGELLVVTGRRTVGPDGLAANYRLVFGPGRFLRMPFIERVDRMDLLPFRVPVTASNVYAKDGRTMTASLVASVRVSTDPLVTKLAVERFLGRSRQDAQQVVVEAFEGVFRTFAGTHPAEDLARADEKMRHDLRCELERECEKLGFTVEGLEIESITA